MNWYDLQYRRIENMNKEELYNEIKHIDESLNDSFPDGDDAGDLILFLLREKAERRLEEFNK